MELTEVLLEVNNHTGSFRIRTEFFDSTNAAPDDGIMPPPRGISTMISKG
jgi:hypothetical protein